MKQLKLLVLLFTLHFCAQNLPAQRFLGCEKKKLWNDISQYFVPPAEYVGNYGNYRSPLKFYDGNTVKTKADWQKRRVEIKDKWMNMMGEWPLLTATRVGSHK